MKKFILIAIVVFSTLQLFSQSALMVGDKAPAFIATDNSGHTINLQELLKTNKALVLFFYRGQWCPYCNKQIMHLQDSLQLLTAKGAYIIGVTPETNDNIGKTVEKTKASFSIIKDQGYKIMKAYNVNYVVDDKMFARLKGYGVDLEKNNGNADHVLPVPATYIIDNTGKIIYAHFDKDYTKRSSVSSLLNALN